jgi:hypothetical protein
MSSPAHTIFPAGDCYPGFLLEEWSLVLVRMQTPENNCFDPLFVV